MSRIQKTNNAITLLIIRADGDGSGEEEDEEEDQEVGPTPSKKPRKETEKDMDRAEREIISATTESAKKSAPVPTVSDDRYKHFMRLLYKLVQQKYQVTLVVKATEPFE